MQASEIANLFTIAVGFSVFGGLLDKVTSEVRRRHQLNLRSPSYFNIVFSFYAGFYEKIFPGSAVSWNYIKRSTLASLAIITSLTAIYWVIDPRAVSLIFPEQWESYLFATPLMLGYIFIFWLVSAQTKLFIEESLDTKSALSRIVYIVSDILASSNIFIFIFSFFIFISASLFKILLIEPYLESQELAIRVEIEKNSFISAEYVSADISDSSNLFEVKITRLENESPLPDIDAGSRYTIVANTDYFDPEYFIPSGTGDIKATGLPFINGKSNDKNELKAIVSNSTKASYYEDFPFQHPGFAFNFADYSLSYLMVDAVEDSFWKILDLRATLKNADDAFNLLRGYSPFDYDPLCTYQGRFFDAPDGSKYTDISCESEGLVVSGVASSSGNHINIAAYKFVSFAIPISIFFLSCMLISGIFYLCVLTSYTFAFAASIPWIKNWILLTYEKAPFATSFFLFGTGIFFLTN